MTFQGKVAVVTGAGRGIGQAVAMELGRLGASVAAVDIDGAAVEGACRLVEQAGGRAEPFVCDIADRGEVENAVQAALKALEGVHVLVNNAGAVERSGLTDLSPEEIERDIDVNLKGHIWMARAVVPHMLERGGGAIVNVASAAAILGAQRAPVYAAAKGGLVALTRSLAKELAPKGIRVNCVCPGPTDSAMYRAAVDNDPEWGRSFVERIPMKRMATPEEVAASIVFLASDEASYITGVTLGVDGGLARAP